MVETGMALILERVLQCDVICHQISCLFDSFLISSDKLMAANLRSPRSRLEEGPPNKRAELWKTREKLQWDKFLGDVLSLFEIFGKTD